MRPSAEFAQPQDRSYRTIWRGLASICTLVMVAAGIAFASTSATAQSGQPPFGPVISSAEEELSSSASWGDYDNDGDLDLAVGNAGQPTSTSFVGQPNRIYCNNKGQLIPVWRDTDSDPTLSLAWGDYDLDGWLDLAVGNYNAPSHIYRNLGGAEDCETPRFALVWSSPKAFTTSVAWGDYDDNGRPDLAIGNGQFDRDGNVLFPVGQPNLIYRNLGVEGEERKPILESVALPGPSMPTTSVAWADVEGDGDLDLAAGNIGVRISAPPFDPQTFGGPSVLYINDKGTFRLADWQPPLASTFSIAWGDYDNDDDQDLAAGNASLDDSTSDILFRNDGGALTNTPVWTSEDKDATINVAWGDYDGDGDLDLMAGNAGGGLSGNVGQVNRLYPNTGGNLEARPIWPSPQRDDTFNVSWVDVDRDGDLDTFAANGGALVIGNAPGQSNRLYINQTMTLATEALLPDSKPDDTTAVAWGDVDGNGYIDAVVAVIGEPLRLYRNGSNGLTRDEGWRPISNASDLAFGDLDSDGDLDLVVGNFEQPSQIFRNTNGELQLDDAWRPAGARTVAIALGDIDNDDDLDLLVGNFEQPSQLYLNTARQLSSTPAWTSPSAPTRSVAWGDVDQDGDADLAIGNSDEPSQLFRNDAGSLQLVADWRPSPARTRGLAWGDMNGDGYPELAEANDGGRLRIFANDKGALQTQRPWQSTESSFAADLAWSDLDNDGDLDLGVGTTGFVFDGKVSNEPDLVFRNDGGSVSREASWVGPIKVPTWSIAWVDLDNDGDLDLAAPSALYRNQRGPPQRLPDNPPSVYVRTPVLAVPHGQHGVATVLRQPVIPISYTLRDLEDHPVRAIRAFFSSDGGGTWRPATPTAETPLRDLAASRDGTTHRFDWNAAADLIKSDEVLVRMEVYQSYMGTGPYQHAYLAATTLPFRVEAAAYFATVVDEAGRAIEGATVYLDGAPLVDERGVVRRTDRAGRVRIDPAPGETLEGRTLVALSLVETLPTRRKAHDGWAYRVYKTNVSWLNSGELQAATITAPGEQRLVLRTDGPLILFNLVVSIEWAADQAYIDEISRALRQASAYLFDVTDGQMALGQVRIYTSAENWADADIQIAARTGVRPHAWIDGMRDSDTTLAIRAGRGWSGRLGSQVRGFWDAKDGYRTLIHEFGHYALGLYDSYITFIYRNGELVGERPATCTGPENLEENRDDTASIMDHQYGASELAMRDVTGLWSDACLDTAQWFYKQASDWEAVAATFADTTQPPRWRIITPALRGAVLPGPLVEGKQWPRALPAWPTVSAAQPDPNARRYNLTVLGVPQQPQRSIIVALVSRRRESLGNQVIIQGFTDSSGRLEILGARPGDLLRAATLDGAYAGELELGEVNELWLSLQPAQVAAAKLTTTASPPSMRVFAEREPGGGEANLTIVLSGFDTDLTPELAATAPGSDIPFNVPLRLDSNTGDYTGRLVVAQTRGVGQVRVLGASGGRVARLLSTYRVQEARSDQLQDLFADDGFLQLHIPPGSVPGERVAIVARATGVLPGLAPAGMQPVGDVYDLTASGAVTRLQGPALLRLYYDGPPTGVAPELYRWDPARQVWERVPAIAGSEPQTLAATIETLGAYALFAPLPPPARQNIYLPLLRR